jgi:hypothetical protein
MLVILCVGFSLDPLVGPFIVGAAWLAALTLGILAAAMLLGLVGTLLFAAGDRLLAGLRRSSRWPED